MKRLLSLVLAALLALSLCACGGNASSATPDTVPEEQDRITLIQQEYPGAIEQIAGTWASPCGDPLWFTIFEDGTLEFNGETLEWQITDFYDEYWCLKSLDDAYYFDYSAYSSSLTVTHNDEYYSEYHRLETPLRETTVELTADNWKDYFEIVYTADFQKNPFHEFDLLVIEYDLQLREEYQYRICQDSHIAMEMKYVVTPAHFTADVNAETFQYDFSDATGYVADSNGSDMFSITEGHSWGYLSESGGMTTYRLRSTYIWPVMFEGVGIQDKYGNDRVYKTFPDENGIIDIDGLPMITDLSIVRIEGVMHTF